MPIPLAEIDRILERERQLRRDLGSRVLCECCMQCELKACDTASSGCRARQLRNARRRAFYRRHRPRIKAQRRADYRANREAVLQRVREYESDPIGRHAAGYHLARS
ncbi:MAG TPA: hypothetical protein DCZ11_06685, partial [Gammaproteobacteria bacterium]|nr:hypothetical protein [Gammaproteobacteria bacterium]MCH78112.1 hypothetical protein [Gammaproteobacteria bacterium]